jgi:hypothetical protein
MANLEEVLRRFKEAGLNYQITKKFHELEEAGGQVTTKLWNMIVS